MFSFGAPRQAYSRVYCAGQIPHDRDIPGPGAYVIPQTSREGKNPKFSMSKKIPRTCKFIFHTTNLNFLILLIAHLAITSTTPGPGTYNNSLKNYNGNPVLSDHRNNGTPLLHLPIK
jgi:hypothetical protein